MVTDNLETANHLTDGEETQALGGNNTTGNELTVADVTGLLDKVLGSLEESAVLEGFPEGLVGVLEGGDGTMMPSMLELFEFFEILQCKTLRNTYGGLIFWPWKTSLATSAPTLE